MDIFSRNTEQDSNIELPEQNYSIERVEVNGKRHYQVTDSDGSIIGVMPSVTSVLGATKDTSGLDRWRKRVGEAQAEKIGKDATDRGTVMHRLCELYCNFPSTMKKEEKLQQMLEDCRHDEEILQFDARAIVVGSQLFYNFYQTGFFDRIKKGVFQEKFLWNKLEHEGEDLSYAGTVDNFSEMDDDILKVVDFKTSKKAKDEKWIISYKKQCAAYAYAIKERYNLMPQGAEIWISNEVDRFPQCFTLNESDLKFYFKEFLKDRIKFNSLFNKKSIDDIL
tara:strand:+ start:12452 stop:13288 length:837 start_codon:yes stop_codon:yes gene_type:complete